MQRAGLQVLSARSLAGTLGRCGGAAGSRFRPRHPRLTKQPRPGGKGGTAGTHRNSLTLAGRQSVTREIINYRKQFIYYYLLLLRSSVRRTAALRDRCQIFPTCAVWLSSTPLARQRLPSRRLASRRTRLARRCTCSLPSHTRLPMAGKTSFFQLQPHLALILLPGRSL